MGQLSSYQETELASRDLQAKPSIEEDSIFPDKHSQMLAMDTKGEVSLPSLVERLKPNSELLLEVSVETKLNKANTNQEGLSQVCRETYEKDKLARVDHTKPSMVEGSTSARSRMPLVGTSLRLGETMLPVVVSWLSVLMS